MMHFRLSIVVFLTATCTVFAVPFPNRAPDTGLIFLSAWSRHTIDAYLNPTDQDIVCTEVIVANQGIYQVIHFKGSNRAMMYFLEYVRNTPESIRISNSGCLKFSDGEWQVDDTPAAEGPTGGLATRKLWQDISGSLLKRETEICTWAYLKSVLEKMPPPSLPDPQ